MFPRFCIQDKADGQLSTSPNAPLVILWESQIISRNFRENSEVTFCYTTAGIGASFRTHGRTVKVGQTAAEGQTDVEVEIVI